MKERRYCEESIRDTQRILDGQRERLNWVTEWLMARDPLRGQERKDSCEESITALQSRLDDLQAWLAQMKWHSPCRCGDFRPRRVAYADYDSEEGGYYMTICANCGRHKP